MKKWIVVAALALAASAAEAQVAYRTTTALDGTFCPSPDATAYWARNPGGMAKARFFVRLVTRGTTALADAPTITLRPFIRTGGTGGQCGSGTAVTAVRPVLSLAPTVLKVKKTVNDGVAYTDYSTEAGDGSATTHVALGGLDTLANGDWFLITSPVPFVGLAVDMDASVNANASTMTCQYWNGAWTGVASFTDGTKASTAILSQDGQITWALPTDWITSTIDTVAGYQLRCTTSAALSATVNVDAMSAILPTRVAVDLQVDGDDAGLLIESNSGGTGTLAFDGTVTVAWK